MEEAEMHFDDDMEPDPELNQWTNAIIGAAIAVHRELGPGHVEATYDNALDLEFRARAIPFKRQVVVPIFYRGQRVGTTRLDFIVADAVVVESKAIEAFAPIHTAQCISYLKASNLRLAILINFNVRKLKDGIKRIAR